MKRILVAFTTMLLAVSVGYAQSPNAEQVRFQDKDTVKILFMLDDSTGIRVDSIGQLLSLWLRSSVYGAYGAGEGIHIETQSPDGDSIRAGIWLQSDGKLRLISSAETRLLLDGSGGNFYGNFVVRPDYGDSLPYVTLKNSLGESVILTMTNNNSPSWNKPLNLSNTWNDVTADDAGDFGRSGNILKFRDAEGHVVGFDFTGTPTAGMGWRFNGTNYVFGYDDSSGGGGGGGYASLAWDSLLAPAADLGLNMTAFSTTFTYGDVGAEPSLRLTDNAGATSDPLFQVDVGAGSNKDVVRFFNSSGNGVVVTNAGVLQPMGSGAISASQFNGNTIIPYTSLDPNLARINASQVYSANVEINQGSDATSLQTYNTLNAPANATGLYAEAYYGTAGRFRGRMSGSKGVSITSPGLGLAVNSDNDTIATFRYNNGLIASVRSNGIRSTDFLHPSSDSTLVVYGDGWRRAYHGKARFGANDTAVVTGLTGMDSSNAIVSLTFINKPDAPATLGGWVNNSGTLYITCSAGGMNGTRVYYSVFRSNTTAPPPPGDQ